MYKGNVKSSEDFMLLLGRLKTAAGAETYRKQRGENWIQIFGPTQEKDNQCLPYLHNRRQDI